MVYIYRYVYGTFHSSHQFRGQICIFHTHTIVKLEDIWRSGVPETSLRFLQKRWWCHRAFRVVLNSGTADYRPNDGGSWSRHWEIGLIEAISLRVMFSCP